MHACASATARAYVPAPPCAHAQARAAAPRPQTKWILFSPCAGAGATGRHTGRAYVSLAPPGSVPKRMTKVASAISSVPTSTLMPAHW